MEQEDIPDDVRRFVLAGIPSVPCLEALLLMHADPGSDWDAPLVARRVYISEHEAAEILAYLHRIAVVAACDGKAGCYRFQPAHDDLKRTLDRLAATYSSHLVLITNLIHNKGSRRAQHFADAFKWRKDR
ncbi:MAG TPA: hypothetical protein VIT92_09640 [Burkholderiaceae bacterium]